MSTPEEWDKFYKRMDRLLAHLPPDKQKEYLEKMESNNWTVKQLLQVLKTERLSPPLTTNILCWFWWGF